MTALQNDTSQAGRGPLRPCEHFDIITGTSYRRVSYSSDWRRFAHFERLIAVILVVLPMDIATCIKAYIRMAPNLFTIESRLSSSTLGRFAKMVAKTPRFNPIPLKNAVKRLVVEQLKERATDGENTPMGFEVTQHGLDRQCKV